MSPKQMVVVQLVCCGLADKEIAHILALSPATVKAHVSKVLKEMGLYRRPQLVRYIFENNLFDPERAHADVSTLGSAVEADKKTRSIKD